MAPDRPDESFAALFEKAGSVPRRDAARTGDQVEATVVQVGKDAVFVEFGGRAQGYIEALDLKGPDGATKAAVGDRLRARVVRIDDQGVRLVPTVEAAVAAGASVSLGAADDDAAPKLALGQVISGVVDRVESYGVFLQLDGTRGRAGRGLLPVSELLTPRGADLRKHFSLGTKLRAKIIGLEEGKMRLSLRAMKDDEERAEVDGFREREKKTAEPRGFGTLGDLMKKKR